MDAPTQEQVEEVTEAATAVELHPIYMLEESRTFYGDVTPPFTVQYRSLQRGYDLSEDGTRPVILELKALTELFGDLVTDPKPSITLTRYTDQLGFWALGLGRITIIIRPTGQGYFAWLGPQKQFTSIRVARSNLLYKQAINEGSPEKRQSHIEPQIPLIFSDEEEPDLTEGPPLTGVALQERTPDSAKPTWDDLHTSSRKGPTTHSAPKRPRTVYPSDDDGDYRPGYRPAASKRGRLSTRSKRNANFGDFLSSPPSSSKPRHNIRYDDSKPLESPNFITLKAPVPKRKTPTAPRQSQPSTTSPQARGHVAHLESNPSDNSLAPDQLSNTTFHISLSSNTYGAVPVKLNACPTIDTFFQTVLSAWELESQASQVAALSVIFKWLPDEEPMVVTRVVPSSLETMLETINEAPCWENTDAKRKCDVKVKIIMK